MTKYVKFLAVFKGSERVIYVNADNVELVYDHKHQGDAVVCVETKSKQSMLIVKESLSEVLAKLLAEPTV